MAYMCEFAYSSGGTEQAAWPIGSALFGTCGTSASTTQKSVTLTAFDYLHNGITVVVRFTNENTASNPTLKVGSTTAKNIKLRTGVNAGPGAWQAGDTVQFTYNTSDDAWIMTSGSSGTQTRTSSSNTFHPLLAGPNQSGSASFDTGCDAILDTNSAIYETTSNKNALFLNKVCASDGGALVSTNYSVAQLWNDADVATDTAAKTGITINANSVRHQAKYQDSNETSGWGVLRRPILQGYPQKIPKTAYGQIAYLSGGGLTIVSGGTLGDTLAGEIGDDQSDTTTSTKLTLFRDSNGDPITDVGYGFHGGSQHLILASNQSVLIAVKSQDQDYRRGVYVNPGSSTSTASFGPAETEAVRLGSNSHKWLSCYALNFYGELNGTISTGTTAVTQNVGTSSTRVATTEFVKSNTYGRHCAISYEESNTFDPSKPWGKVAEFSPAAASGDSVRAYKTIFVVSQILNDTSKQTGILSVSHVTRATGTTLDCKWLLADPEINSNNFELVAIDSISSGTNTATIELWVKLDRAYQCIILHPIQEQSRARQTLYWSFTDYDNLPTLVANPTVGTTNLTSTLETLQNNISGNAATATTATSADYATSAGSATTATSATTADSATDATNAENANKLKVSTTNPSSQTTYYPLFQSSGTSSAKTTYYNTGLRYLTKVGTTGTSGVIGLARLQLGYGSSSASTSDKAGEIVMYSEARNQYTMTLKPAKVTDSNKTILLQNKSGTIAVAYNGGSMYFQNNTSAWGKVMSIVCTPGSAAKIFGVMLAIQQSAGSSTSVKAAGILQVSVRFESSTGNITDANTHAMWMYAAGNITTSRFKLVAHHATPASGSGTIELWIQNVANYQTWTVTPITENTNNAEVGMFFTFHDSRDGSGSDSSLISSTTPTGDLVKNSEIMTPVTS